MNNIIQKIIKNRLGKPAIICVPSLNRIKNDLTIIASVNHIWIVRATLDDCHRVAGVETDALYFIDVNTSAACVEYLLTRLRGASPREVHFYYT